MSYEKAYKISLIFFIAITLIALVVTTQVEGYSDSVAKVAILALSGHWLIHNVIALRYGQIDIKGFVINRKNTPNKFALALIFKGVFAILFTYLILR